VGTERRDREQPPVGGGYRQRGLVHDPSVEPPAPGTKLQVDGRDAEITSSVYSPHFGKVIALAYVRTA